MRLTDYSPQAASAIFALKNILQETRCRSTWPENLAFLKPITLAKPYSLNVTKNIFVTSRHTFCPTCLFWWISFKATFLSLASGFLLTPTPTHKGLTSTYQKTPNKGFNKNNFLVSIPMCLLCNKVNFNHKKYYHILLPKTCLLYTSEHKKIVYY